MALARYVTENALKFDQKMSNPTKQDIADAIRAMVQHRGTTKTACPSEVARKLAGNDEKKWRLLMKPIRAEAVQLAVSGEIEIRRKGKTVDPTDFKGVYRLGQRRP